jgi:hypothetical protein
MQAIYTSETSVRIPQAYFSEDKTLEDLRFYAAH